MEASVAQEGGAITGRKRRGYSIQQLMQRWELVTVDAIGYGGAREPARLTAGCEGGCWSERVIG